ncbi:MAG: hypothetical protein CM1200mP10_26050 [Candidatus Neomarinimicrobiota bacterium]|nr:MAG: hypothetical protein CM1200mP10_26050 [Candidatus Neomarinimicrobiota bacterium]
MALQYKKKLKEIKMNSNKSRKINTTKEIFRSLINFFLPKTFNLSPTMETLTVSVRKSINIWELNHESRIHG